MFHTLVKGLFAIGMLAMVGCTPDKTSPVTPDTPPVVPDGVAFNVVGAFTATDSIVKLEVRWPQAGDAFGTADSYRHTMTSSKLVTDATTGPLPNNKTVTGLRDTVSIKLAPVNDEVTLNSSIWSVRRGLQSTTPAQGTLVVRRGDRPPPPPDSVRIDTIAVPFVGSFKTSSSSSVLVPLFNVQSGLLHPVKRQENGITIITTGTVTVITLPI